VTAPCVVFYHAQSASRNYRAPEPRGAPGVPRPVQALYFPAIREHRTCVLVFLVLRHIFCGGGLVLIHYSKGERTAATSTPLGPRTRL
jgi:hypothetical protein